jgi:pyrroloquinoline quinone (PQQ) biosynthesis protein C
MSGHERTTRAAVLSRLADDDARRRLIGHRLLEVLQNRPLTRQSLAVALGQYWHPIHYFTEFLARCLTAVGDLELRSRLSLILFQELGQGDPTRAHESLYLNAAQRAGIPAHDIRGSKPLLQTEALVSGFREATATRPRAIAYLYATEIIDLRLVKSLGSAITRASGGAAPDWVKVHEQQEGDHVMTARALVALLPVSEVEEVLEHAGTAWTRWQQFYDGIGAAIGLEAVEAK